MTELKKFHEARVLEAVCRTDFGSFTEKCFRSLNPGTEFLPNWHIDAMAHHLELVRLGKIKRLIINVPPRTLKSLTSSVAYPAFVLGHDPTKRLIVVSYGSNLAITFSNHFRAIINEEWYRRLFPATRISRGKNTEFEVATTRHGFRLSTSVDGSVTGRGGNIVIIDDPQKPDDADARRQTVNDWFFNTLLSRLDNQQTGAIVIVMQRLHVDDLAGTLLRSSDEWTLLSLPAIAEQEEEIAIGEDRYHSRRVGELLHPERLPLEFLESMRSWQGSDTFAAQYQQTPNPLDGALIKRGWIRRYDQPPARDSSSFVIQSWDTASKEGGQNDWSACTTWLVHKDVYYLVHVLRSRFDYPTLKERAKAHAHSNKPDIILIEEGGVGTALVSELQGAGLPAIGVKVEHNKLIRMSIQSAKFESGRVHLPKDAPWLKDFEEELFAFPNGRHDDQIDAVSQALAHQFSQSLWGDRSLEGYAQLVAALGGWR
jgi:predicted phage terminase large subunit-like protein